MPRTVIYTCKKCGTTRDKNNGWFLGKIKDLISNVREYIIRSWNDEDAVSDEFDHICSIKCMGQLIDDYIHPTMQNHIDNKMGTVTAETHLLKG